MDEKTNIQQLKELAKAKNKTLEVRVHEYPLSKGMIRNFPKFKKQIYMPISLQASTYMVWHSDHYHMGKMTELYLFCGAFIPVNFPQKAHLNIRRKNIMDRWNIFAKKGFQTGNSQFDSKVIMQTNDSEASLKWLSRSRLQREIVKALDHDPSLKISINEVEVDFVPGLQGKSHLSILNSQLWYLEKKQIDPLMKSIVDLQKQLSPSIYEG